MTPLVTLLREAADAIEGMEARAGLGADARLMACIHDAAATECQRRGWKVGPWWHHPGRTREAVTVRRAAMIAALDAGYSKSAIARALGMDHSSVSAMLRGHRQSSAI